MREAIEWVITYVREAKRTSESQYKLDFYDGVCCDGREMLGRATAYGDIEKKLKEVLSQHETSPQVRSQADAGDR